MNDVITKNTNKKVLLRSIIVVLMFFFASYTQIIPIKLFNMDINNLSAKDTVLLATFSDFILVVVLTIIYRKTLKEDFKKLKDNFYSCMDCGIKYWLLGLVTMMVSNILIMFIFTEAKAGNEEGVQNLIAGSGFISLIAIGILGPIIEELTFRKAFHDVFKNKWLFVLISSFIFGGLHVVLTLNSLWDLVYIIPYCSLGVAFGLMYAKTANIYTSIIMHMFHNTAITTISIFGAMILL